MTLQEAKALTYGQIVYHKTRRNSDGTPQRWRVSGQVKTWKRSPERVKIPVKHGLYDNDYIEEDVLDQLEITEEAAR